MLAHDVYFTLHESTPAARAKLVAACKKYLTKHKIEPTDLAFQLNNWYHFVWICGDHIVEQHVHDIDVCNWAMKGPPKMALSSGGRAQLPRGNPQELGHIYDHFSTEYVYENGVHMHSMCRQLDGCDGNFPGTNGHAEAIAGGDSRLAAAVLDQAQPESPDGSAATVSGCIGLALGLLDQWLSGHDADAPAGLAKLTRLPAGSVVPGALVPPGE